MKISFKLLCGLACTCWSLGLACADELSKVTFAAPSKATQAFDLINSKSAQIQLKSFNSDLTAGQSEFDQFKATWLFQRDFTQGITTNSGRKAASYSITINYVNGGAQGVSLDEITFGMGLGDLATSQLSTPNKAMTMKITAEINANGKKSLSEQTYDMSQIFKPNALSDLSLKLKAPIAIAKGKTFSLKLTFSGHLQTPPTGTGAAPVMSYISLNGK